MGYIQIVATQPASGPTGTSHLYRLTDTGQRVLEWELDRYAKAAELGRERIKILQARH
jgi:hypothetical protein